MTMTIPRYIINNYWTESSDIDVIICQFYSILFGDFARLVSTIKFVGGWTGGIGDQHAVMRADLSLR